MPNKLDVLAVYPRVFWRHKHSQVRRHVIEAMQRSDKLTCVLSGHGWDSWNSDAPINENVARLMPEGCHFLWLYKPQGSTGRMACPPLIGLEDCELPKLQRFHEAWWLDVPKHRSQLFEETRFCDLAVHTHANDARRFEAVGIRHLHIPQTAEPRLYSASTPHKSRPINMLLTGTISSEHYPLRVRLKSLIEQGKLPGAKIRNHPGYVIRDAPMQTVDYARHLAQTKIVLACTSRWRYALGKHVESMMAGCAVVSDMPDDHIFEGTLGRHIIRIDPSWPDDRIVDHIKWWVDRPTELQQLARAGQQVAMELYTHDAYCDSLFGALNSMP